MLKFRFGGESINLGMIAAGKYTMIHTARETAVYNSMFLF